MQRSFYSVRRPRAASTEVACRSDSGCCLRARWYDGRFRGLRQRQRRRPNLSFKLERNPANRQSEPLGHAGHDSVGVVRLWGAPRRNAGPGHRSRYCPGRCRRHTPLVHIGTRVYFFERRGSSVSAQMATTSPRSGRVNFVGAGINLTTTTDGHDLLVAMDPFHLVELSPTGARLSPVWTVPSGYTLNTYAPQHPLAAVAGGIAIESASSVSTKSGNYVLAIWDPTTGTVRALGVTPLSSARTHGRGRTTVGSLGSMAAVPGSITTGWRSLIL